jgi:hypothetical protein
MMDWAKAIHTAFGIEFPRLFMTSFAILGAILFGFVGWVVDRDYRVAQEQAAQQAVQAAKLAASQQSRAKPPSPKSVKGKTSPQHIQQSSKGSNSPNIVTGDNSTIDIRSKE